MAKVCKKLLNKNTSPIEKCFISGQDLVPNRHPNHHKAQKSLKDRTGPGQVLVSDPGLSPNQGVVHVRVLGPGSLGPGQDLRNLVQLGMIMFNFICGT